VGGLGTQIAKALGAKVITTVGSRAKYEKAQTLGANYVVDLSAEKLEETVWRVTDGRGVDVALDSLGGEIAGPVLAAMAPSGRLVMVGYSAGTVSSINIFNLLKPVSIHGFNLFAMPGEALGAAYEQIRAWLAGGTVRAVVDRTFPLAQAAEAHRYAASRQPFGRVVLTI
jgi:NADPH:quinone reductase-like Zn-dependent oxidoreductase